MATLTTTDPGAHLGASVLRAIVFASVVVFAVTAGVTFASGQSVIDAVGVGAFCAAWGGPGFGGMIAGVQHVSRTGADHP